MTAPIHPIPDEPIQIFPEATVDAHDPWEVLAADRPVRDATDALKRERGGNIVNMGDVVIVRDDARVIRLTLLRRLLEVAGDMRTLAEALGISASTISRALAEQPEPADDRNARIAAVRHLLNGDA